MLSEDVNGRLFLEKSTESLVCFGEHISLSKNSFKLLAVLLEKKSFLSVNDLKKSVWETDYVSDDAIYQSIRTLRKELNDTQRPFKYVVSVSGKGYFFDKEKFLAYLLFKCPSSVPTKNSSRISSVPENSTKNISRHEAAVLNANHKNSSNNHRGISNVCNSKSNNGESLIFKVRKMTDFTREHCFIIFPLIIILHELVH